MSTATAFSATEAPPACPDPVPDGMGVVALFDGGWTVHLSDEAAGRWVPVETEREVRTFSFSRERGELLYAAADGSVRSRPLGSEAAEESELATAGEQLRQPRLAGPDGTVYAVRFKDGASSDTEIVRVNRDSPDDTVPVVTQPGAVFSPVPDAFGRTLLYTVAHCTERCGRIIQEVWRKDLVSGRADQLTLGGAMSADPVAGEDGEPVYFAVQDESGEAVVRFDPETRTAERRFRVGERNRHPALDGEGRLHFLTEVDGRAVIARFGDGDDGGCHFPFPETFDDARELVAGS